MDYIAKDVIERVVESAMSQFIDKEAVEDKFVTPENNPKKPKVKPTAPKRPKPVPKTPAIISSSEDEDPAPSGVVKKQDSFIDDEGVDEGLDDQTQAEFDAMKRKEMQGKLKKKMEAEANKRKRKGSSNLESTPKRVKLSKKIPSLNHITPIVDKSSSESEEDEQPENKEQEWHTDEDELDDELDDEQLINAYENQQEEDQLTPEERIRTNQCPFCFGALAIGSTPDEKTGEEKLWAFCSKNTCKWTYVPPNKLHQFIVEAHMTLNEQYQYPNTKKLCKHNIPLQATWIHSVDKMKNDEDAAILKGCIFLVCEIGKKDKENRVPCNTVILANAADGVDPKPIEKRYKRVVIERKIASRKTEKRFAFDMGTALDRFKSNPRNQRDYGKKLKMVRTRR